MGKLGKLVSKYPKTTIVAIVVITLIAVGCMQIFGIEQQFSEESFMPENEVAKASNEISEQYSTTDTYNVSILVKSKNGDLLTSDALIEMLRIEKDIINDSDIKPTLKNPEVASVNVNSVADIIAQMALVQQNITMPTMDQKIFAIQNMNDAQVKQLISGILSSDRTPPMIKGMFSMMLTKDFDPVKGKIKAKATMIMVSLNASIGGAVGNGPMGHGLTTEESELSESEKRMAEIVKNTELKSTQMTVMGTSIIMNEIMDANNASMAILLPLALGLVIIILAIIYRNAFDILFSLLALGFAMIWVYGFGSAMGYTFNPMTTAVPVLLVGLGIDYGIHIIMRYREEIRDNKKVKESVRITIKSVGMALLLATITTVAAFLSNLTSPIGLLGEFGVLCAIGIIGSFVTMTTFVPACKQLRDLRRLKKGKPVGKARKDINNKRRRLKNTGVAILDRTMSSGAVAAEHHPIAVVIIVAIITIVAVGMALQLKTAFDFEDFLPADLEISKDIEFMMSEFQLAGSEAEKVNILVKGGITDPELLRDIDETIENMKDDNSVIKHAGEPDVQSILSFMEDWATDTTHYGMQDPNFDPDFKAIYDTVMINGIPKPNVTKEDINFLYNWLYLNPKSTKAVQSILHRTDNNYDGAVLRISVNVDINDNEAIETLHSDLNKDKKLLDESADESIITGGPILTKVIMNSLNNSQIRSLIITIIISLLVLTIVFWYKWRSLILGVITLTPVTLCVIWTFGTMYLVDIPLNIMTITIACLTIGLGITYGIHITHRFLEDLGQFDSIDDACRNTVNHTGTALFGAAATTIGGFGLLVFALMPPLQQFGGISALSILYSFLASVFVLPTLLVMWAKWKQKRSKGNQNA